MCNLTDAVLVCYDHEMYGASRTEGQDALQLPPEACKEPNL